MATKAKKTGDTCEETATYRASCGCGFSVRVVRAHLFPECVICGKSVVWYGADSASKAGSDSSTRDVLDDRRTT